MNALEAKRIARDRAAELVRASMEVGWPFNDEPYAEEDEDRISLALLEVADELQRRRHLRR